MAPHKLLACLESNCKYSLTPHFKRKDNLVDHLKRVHKYSQADARAKANSGDTSQAISLGIQPSQAVSTSTATETHADENVPRQDRTHYIVPESSKKRRLSQTASHTGEASDLPGGSREEPYDEEGKWKRKAARYEGEMEALRAQNNSLRTQNELLESRIQRLEENQDSLIAVLAAKRSS